MKIIYCTILFIVITAYNTYAKTSSNSSVEHNSKDMKVAALLGKEHKSIIEELRGGVGKYLRVAKYEDFSNFIISLNKVSKQVREYPLDIILSKYSKPKVLKAFIGGLYNFDPRVRITCALVLQDMVSFFKNVRIKKDKNALAAELIRKRHKYIYLKLMTSIHPLVRQVWYAETVNSRMYKTVDINGQEISKSPYNEINILDLLIIREIAAYKLQNAYIKAEDFGETVDLRIFIALTTKLSDDTAIFSLKNSAPILINSLGYENKKIQTKVANLLIKVYYDPATNNQIKRKISKAREVNKLLEDKFQNYIKKKKQRE